VKRSAVIALSILTTVVSGGAYFVSPYYAIHEITTAARDKDFITLNEHVDYPAVRENLKDQVAAKVAAEVRRTSGASAALEMLESAAASAILDKVIDLVIRPDSLSRLLEAGSLQSPSSSKTKARRSKVGTAATAKSAGTGTDAQDPSADTTVGFHGFNRFEIAVRPRDKTIETVRFVLARRGFLHWDLIAVLIPMEDLSL
jgi:Protein of unknown function (DUF2939)